MSPLASSMASFGILAFSQCTGLPLMEEGERAACDAEIRHRAQSETSSDIVGWNVKNIAVLKG